MSKKEKALNLALDYLLSKQIGAHIIAALREALAEQPAPPPECQTEAEKTAFAFGWWKALEHVRQQPAQQEPVAVHQYRSPHCSDWYDGVPDHHDGHGPYEVRTLYTSPPAQQEPAQRYSPDGEGGMEIDSLGAWVKFTTPPAQQGQVAWTLLLTGENQGLVGKAGEKFVGHPEHYERVDVYTSPRRTWVGLTDEDENKLLEAVIGSLPVAKNLIRAIEAKLREQNT